MKGLRNSAMVKEKKQMEILMTGGRERDPQKFSHHLIPSYHHAVKNCLLERRFRKFQRETLIPIADAYTDFLRWRNRKIWKEYTGHQLLNIWSLKRQDNFVMPTMPPRVFFQSPFYSSCRLYKLMTDELSDLMPGLRRLNLHQRIYIFFVINYLAREEKTNETIINFHMWKKTGVEKAEDYAIRNGLLGYSKEDFQDHFQPPKRINKFIAEVVETDMSVVETAVKRIRAKGGGKKDAIHTQVIQMYYPQLSPFYLLACCASYQTNNNTAPAIDTAIQKFDLAAKFTFCTTKRWRAWFMREVVPFVNHRDRKKVTFVRQNLKEVGKIYKRMRKSMRRRVA